MVVEVFNGSAFGDLHFQSDLLRKPDPELPGNHVALFPKQL
jgi:hypothetical protein